MNVEITYLRCLIGNGPDRILMYTTLPTGTYPFEGVAVLTLDVAQGNGVNYCVAAFGRNPDEVIEVG